MKAASAMVEVAKAGWAAAEMAQVAAEEVMRAMVEAVKARAVAARVVVQTPLQVASNV